MAQKEDDGDKALLFIFMMFGAVMAFVAVAIGMFVIGVLTIASLYMSVIAFRALFGPIYLNGIRIDPEDAQIFFIRGFFGIVFAIVLPIIATALSGWHIFRGEYWYLYVLVGYVLGTAVVEILIGEANGWQVEEYTPPRWPRQIEEPRALPRPEPEPFRYASWNDEDGQ